MNQSRVHLKVNFISDLLWPGSRKIKGCFRQGPTDEAAFSEFSCIQSNQAKTVFQLGRKPWLTQAPVIVLWNNLSGGHPCMILIERLVREWVTTTLLSSLKQLRMKKWYSLDLYRYSHRRKRFDVPCYFMPSEETFAGAILEDWARKEFRRRHLRSSPPPFLESSLGRWRSKCARWHFPTHITLKYFEHKCYSTAVDGSRFPKKTWRTPASYFSPQQLLSIYQCTQKKSPGA